MDKGNTSLEKLMLRYEAFNRTEGKTVKTIQWYGLSLHLLNEFLKQKAYSNLLRDLDLELIRTYILHLQTRRRFEGHPHVPPQDCRLSPASVENHVRALRAFLAGSIEKVIPKSMFSNGSGYPKCPRYSSSL